MLYDSILHQCLKAGFSPQIGLEASVQQTVMNFVARGVGVALIPASMENANCVVWFTVGWKIRIWWRIC